MIRGNTGSIKGTFAAIAALIPIVFIGSFLYFQKAPCEAPLTYRIGTLDTRFGVSRDEFLKNIDQAGNIWSDAIGKKLFQYDPKGDLTISLVYDTRQQITQKEDSLKSNIDETSKVAASVKQQYASLKASYESSKQGYQDQLARFNQAQAAYNSQVDYWNSRGGAPQKEYAALTAQKNDLLVQRDALEQKRLQMNDWAHQINALIEKYNLLVEHINSNVETINNDGLTGTQFEQGIYISDREGTRINVYQFNDHTYFIRVLAHELGHALQLDHDEGRDSIMNPINQSKSLVLSPQDLQELKTECKL